MRLSLLLYLYNSITSKAEQKQIENEMIFRRGNEKVGSDLESWLQRCKEE